MKARLLVCACVLAGCARAPENSAAKSDTAGVMLYMKESGNSTKRVVLLEHITLSSDVYSVGIGFYVLKDTVENRTCYLAQGYEGGLTMQCSSRATADSSR